jgi:putative spermidine/putrescine transport system permease protein
MRLSLWCAMATLLAIVLGSPLPRHQRAIPRQGSITVLLVLLIAPRHRHRHRLLAAIKSAQIEPGFWTIVADGVLHRHRLQQRRARSHAQSWIEASMDLGADGWQTFRHIVLPQSATALLAGGMLAFALSFDEIIVTLFTAGHDRTLPIWFFNELFRPRERPITNVVAVIVMIVTFIPILLAYRLTRRGSA